MAAKAATKALPGHKAWVKDFSIMLGFIGITVDLIAPKETGSGDAEKFRLVCPECSEATPVSQGYSCPEGHGPFLPSKCGHAKELEDKSLVKVTDEEYQEAQKTDLEKNVLYLTAHHKGEVQDLTLPSGTSYVTRPAATVINLKAYSALIRIIKEHPELTFMGVCNIRNTEKLMRLDIGLNDQLLMFELAWPGDLRQHDPQAIPVDDSLVDQAMKGIEVTTFDEKKYVKSTRAKVAELVAQKTGTEIAVDEPENIEEISDDLAKFEAMLRKSA